MLLPDARGTVDRDHPRRRSTSGGRRNPKLHPRSLRRLAQARRSPGGGRRRGRLAQAPHLVFGELAPGADRADARRAAARSRPVAASAPDGRCAGTSRGSGGCALRRGAPPTSSRWVASAARREARDRSRPAARSPASRRRRSDSVAPGAGAAVAHAEARTDLARRGGAALDRDAAPQLVERRLVGHPLHLHLVGLLAAESRVRHVHREVAVVGEEEEALRCRSRGARPGADRGATAPAPGR